MFMRICCPRCSHRGLVTSLPRISTCSACGYVDPFKHGETIVPAAPVCEAKPKPPRKRTLVPGEIRAERRRQKATAAATA
jgi:hypothetical protein